MDFSESCYLVDVSYRRLLYRFGLEMSSLVKNMPISGIYYIVDEHFRHLLCCRWVPFDIYWALNDAYIQLLFGTWIFQASIVR